MNRSRITGNRISGRTVIFSARRVTGFMKWLTATSVSVVRVANPAQAKPAMDGVRARWLFGSF